MKENDDWVNGVRRLIPVGIAWMALLAIALIGFAFEVARGLKGTLGLFPDKGASSSAPTGETKTFRFTGGERLEMVRIARGSKDFWIGKYEVTQEQWEAVMGNNPSEFKGTDRPVENVSSYDCQRFVERLNDLPEVKEMGWTFRLPTEEEWKYACRAGSKGDYCRLADGTEITAKTLDEVAWYNDNSGGETHPVGTKKPNAFGLYDMHGNVCERCEKQVWGGCWFDGSVGCQASDWGAYARDSRRPNLGFGFRLAASQDVNR